MKILLVLTIGLVLSIGLYAKESPEHLLENLPKRILFFDAGKIRHYSKPELGASRGYSKELRSSVTWASVYVYDQGFKNITQKIVDESYEMAYQNITTFYNKAIRIDENRGSLNVRLNKSKNIKINYAWFEIVKGDGSKINTYLFVAGDDHYIYKIRISSKKLNKSEVSDETPSSKKISADPEMIYFVKYVLESFDSIAGETSKIVDKTKTSTTYAPNTKGDVFKGGHWAGASGESDWIERDFSSPQLITGVYIGEASTDITTNGFKLVLKLKKLDGKWVTIDELHNTNINHAALSFGAVGKSIPPYTKKMSQAIKATAFRLEFYGHGWFDATDIRIYTSKVSETKENYRVVEYRGACDRGDAYACYDLGFWYEKGMMVEKNDEKANKLYLRACELRSGYCMALAVYFDLSKNMEKAIYYYDKACERRGDACMELAHLYEEGKDGLDKDLEKAKKYYKKAIQREKQ